MDVMEAIKKRRSIRVFKSAPVDQKTLDTILEAGRLAPSWANTQTWRFIVIQDNSVKLIFLTPAYGHFGKVNS